MKNFEIVAEERVFKTPRMEGVKRTFKAEDGETFTHTIIKSAPSVAVIIRKEGKIGFVKQLRSTTGKVYIELPAGLKEPTEDSILDTAKREVKEETGLVVADVYLLIKGPNLLDPSKSDEDFGVAVATVVEKGERKLDENEQIDEELLWLDEDEVFQRLKYQHKYNEPFYGEHYMSGHSIYALMAYQFLSKEAKSR